MPYSDVRLYAADPVPVTEPEPQPQWVENAEIPADQIPVTWHASTGDTVRFSVDPGVFSNHWTARLYNTPYTFSEIEADPSTPVPTADVTALGPDEVMRANVTAFINDLRDRWGTEWSMMDNPDRSVTVEVVRGTPDERHVETHRFAGYSHTIENHTVERTVERPRMYADLPRPNAAIDPAERRRIARRVAQLSRDLDLTPVRRKQDSLIFSGELYNLLQAHYYDNAIARQFVDDPYSFDVDRANYIAIDNGMLSFLPAGREHCIDPDGNWLDTGRQIGKPARVLRMVMGKDKAGQHKDAEFENLVNAIKATDARKGSVFEIVEGREIVYWYDGENYLRDCGSLNASCMRYDHCAPYLDLYVQNPDIIKMLILRDKRTNKIKGRALVWFVRDFPEPFMDRVYGTESVQKLFLRHAQEQGWLVKQYQSYSRPHRFVRNGQPVILEAQIYLPNHRCRYYPYLDTFKYFNWSKGTFSNDHNSQWDAGLNHTEGQGAPYDNQWPNRFVPGETFMRERSALTWKDESRVVLAVWDDPEDEWTNDPDGP